MCGISTSCFDMTINIFDNLSSNMDCIGYGSCNGLSIDNIGSDYMLNLYAFSNDVVLTATNFEYEDAIKSVNCGKFEDS